MDNVKNFSDYVKEKHSATDNVMNVSMLATSLLAGRMAYKISKSLLDEMCYICNVKPLLGSSIISFIAGYRTTSLTIYHLNDLYNVIKEVKDGRG